MAGDWIVWTKGLSRKREVLAIALATGRDRRLVACLLMEFWEWADAETEDGFLPGMSVRILSACHADIGDDVFAAMVAVGWLVERDGGVFLPNFERWNGKSAKRRLQETRRKQADRATVRTDAPKPVRKMSASRAEKNGTTEQNRTEEKNTPLPPKGGEAEIPPELDTPEFRGAWEKWERHRSQKKARLTPLAREQQLRQCVAWGVPRAVAAIEHSVTNGWTGMYEPKAGGAGGRCGDVEEQLRRAKEAVK